MRTHLVQSLIKDADGNFPPLEIVPFTAQEEADAIAKAPTQADIDARLAKLVDGDMASPLVKTILSNPVNEVAFRAALLANYRAVQ